MASRGKSVERVYLGLVQDLSGLLEAARRSSARAVNTVMTATYWEIGRRIVEFEQGGEQRAEYGSELLKRLGRDLSLRFGRGFSRRSLQKMRTFYLAFPSAEIRPTPSAKFESAAPLPGQKICSIVSSEFGESGAGTRFPLPWSHYVLLLSRSRSPAALAFYHAEALSGGWSVRQLDRQIGTQFYERTALSKNTATMLARGAEPEAADADKARLQSAENAVRESRLLDITEYGREVHAEMEALLSCARSGGRTRRGTLFTTTFPCHNCAKHIVGAGLSRVVFVEPYPKSKAFDLHDDALTFDDSERERKVLLQPFVGVGPRRYLDLFTLRLGIGSPLDRKVGNMVAPWRKDGASPRVQMMPMSYLERERVAEGLVDPFWPESAEAKGEGS